MDRFRENYHIYYYYQQWILKKILTDLILASFYVVKISYSKLTSLERMKCLFFLQIKAWWYVIYNQNLYKLEMFNQISRFHYVNFYCKFFQTVLFMYFIHTYIHIGDTERFNLASVKAPLYTISTYNNNN